MASSCAPPVALKVSFTVPAAETFAGQTYATDPSGAIGCACESRPARSTPSAFSATATFAAVFVALRTSTRRSTASPTRRKRGSAERMRMGLVETSSFVPSPTIVSPLIARACRRQVVRLSGMTTSTPALPSSLVTSCASQ